MAEALTPTPGLVSSRDAAVLPLTLRSATSPNSVALDKLRRFGEHRDLVYAPSSAEYLTKEALDKWNGRNGQHGIQHQLNIDLDMIRGRIRKKCSERGVEAIVGMPELRMIGNMSSTDVRVPLQTTIWISCTNRKTTQHVVKHLNTLRWLRNTTEKLGWRLEVRVDSSPVFMAAKYSVSLDKLGRESPIRLRNGCKMFLHVEVPDDDSSVCGTYLCTTVLNEEDEASQHFSRLGGIIDMDGTKVMLTTAHVVLSHILADLPAPEFKSSDNSMSDGSISDESMSESISDESIWDDDGHPAVGSFVSYVPGQIENPPLEQDESHLGYRDPDTVSKWEPVSFAGPMNFLGRDGKTLSSQLAGYQAKWPYPISDFALLVMHCNLAENTYKDGTHPTFVSSLPKEADLQGLSVKILVDNKKPETGFLLPQTSAIEVQSVFLETRKVELSRPLAKGTSGAWVVQGYTLRGMIIAAYEREPFAHMIEVGKLFTDIRQSDDNISSLDLPPKIYTTALHEAVSSENIGEVENLLKRGVPVSLVDDRNVSPLALAAEKGYCAIAELLLNAGKANPESKDKRGQTPLLAASQNGHAAIVKLLLNTGKVEPDVEDNKGRTPLLVAAENGSEAIVKLLLGTGKVNPDSKDRSNCTPLLAAARKGNETIVKLLLETGQVSPNSADLTTGCTPLLGAAESGNEAIFRRLLDTGKVIPDLWDFADRTPLLAAAEEGSEIMVKLLLDSGLVDPEWRDFTGRTPLLAAIEKGSDAVVKLLLATGRVHPSLRDTRGRSPLLVATEKGIEAIVKLLLDEGKFNVADLDIHDNKGRTPLLVASEQGNEAIVKLLLNTGNADPNLSDSEGRTPLLVAVEKGSEAIVKLLLDTGKADLNLSDNEGRRPLHLADEQGNEAIVDMLRAELLRQA